MCIVYIIIVIMFPSGHVLNNYLLLAFVGLYIYWVFAKYGVYRLCGTFDGLQ